MQSKTQVNISTSNLTMQFLFLENCKCVSISSIILNQDIIIKNPSLFKTCW